VSQSATADPLRMRLHVSAAKNRYVGDGEWMQICREKLNICSQTANRYISFYELVSAYLRIVIWRTVSVLRAISFFCNFCCFLCASP